MSAPLDLLNLGLSEDARRTEDEDEHQQGEGEGVFVGAGDIAGGEAFAQAEHKAADHGAGDGPDAAEHSGGEGLDARDEADEEVHLPHVVGDEHAADGGQRRADDERQRDDAVGVDAEQHSHLAVLRGGAHGLAHLRVLDEQRERDHRDEAGDDDQEIAGADDVGNGIQKLKVGDELRKGHEVGRLSQAHIVLEEDRHADGGDEGRKPGSAAQGAIGDLLDGVAVGRAPNHRS